MYRHRSTDNTVEGCSLLSSSSVSPCMPDRWCSEKQDGLYSLKHCRRQVHLLLINLKLSCWALVWYDISYSKRCWSLDRWASYDINSQNAHSAHINNLFLLPLYLVHHATMGTVLCNLGHKILFNFPRYLCGLISICGWQACERTPLTLLERLDMGTDLSGSILNKLLCCQVHFAAICNFFMSIRLKIELTRCMTTGSGMYCGRTGSLWWWMLHNSVRPMKTHLNTIYLMHYKVLQAWLLLNAIQYLSAVSKKHLTTCGKTIKATVGYMVKFGCTWQTRGMGGKQALSWCYIWSSTKAHL